MDRVEQADGEKRVMRVLIGPLKLRGFTKPVGQTKAEFQDMLDGLCAKLAYMSETNLAALEEDAATLAGGKEKDRFPIADRILERARLFQEPPSDASPLIRALFASPLGASALDGGWAPELLAHVKKNRRWPGEYAVSQIKQQADDAMRKMTNLEDALARGDLLRSGEEEWHARRQAKLEQCRNIAALAHEGAAA